MSHTNGVDASQARVEELRRHIRVLEHSLPDDRLIDSITDRLDHLDQNVDRVIESHNKVLGVLNSVLTKLDELVDAQNRTASNFTLLLAGLRLAPPPPPPAPPPQRPPPQPRKVMKPKRKDNR